jgi:acetolactate synthase-1/2/3 large subunit
LQVNGAHSLLNTLMTNGVNICFANPGTSEMHFVAALDQIDGMRCVLGLFEGVVTGAADGYARMADRPASTLLHLGPGLANGLSNLHNAMRAQSPIVNVIGDHPNYHRHYDPPLTSDIEGTARPFSHWVRTSPTADTIATDTAAAVAAAKTAPGRIASLILPADVAWTPISEQSATGPAEKAAVPPTRKPADAAIDAAAAILRSGKNVGLLLGPSATRERPLELAGQIASATGALLYAPTHTARISRGAGRVPVQRLPYPVDQALHALRDIENLILVGAKTPAAFFAYPDKPSQLIQPGTHVHELARSDEDVVYALRALTEAVDATAATAPVADLRIGARPNGELTPEKIGALLGVMLPAQAIVIDESITTGRTFLDDTRTAHPHDWILGTGGAIGYALPCATGAAIACPDRKVIVLESDGSGMYMPQALWTHARESLNILTLVFANRKYQILRNEMKNVGATQTGSNADGLLNIDKPSIDWLALAGTFGVEAFRAHTTDELARHIEAGLAIQGPCLIEVVC